MERQFFSGNTLEQAILAAGRHYNLDLERVAYKLRDKKHGFLNMRRRVVIEVDPASPERPKDTQIERDLSASVVGEHEPMRSRSEQASRDPLEDRETPTQPRATQRLERRHGSSWRGVEPSLVGGNRGDNETDVELDAVESAIEELSKLVDMDLLPSIRRGDKGLDIELSGPECSILREDGGSGLGAIEHLLPRMARGLSGHGVACRVDSEGFCEAHEEELQRLARRTAEDVRRERRAKRLGLMNPAERRLVHLALVDDSSVRTESEGEGFLKRVRVELS